MRPKLATIFIPACPPSELLPNNRRRQGHWGIQAKFTDKARTFAVDHATVETFGNPPFLTPLYLFVHVEYPRRRKLPDNDGTLGSGKAYVDSLADMGIIGDDKQIVLTTVYHEKSYTPKKDAIYPDGFTRMILMDATDVGCILREMGVQ